MKNEADCGKQHIFGCEMDKQAISINHYYMKAENKAQHYNLSFKEEILLCSQVNLALALYPPRSLSPLSSLVLFEGWGKIIPRNSYSALQKDTPGEDLHSPFSCAPSMNSEIKGFLIVRSVIHLPPEPGENNFLSYIMELWNSIMDRQGSRPLIYFAGPCDLGALKLPFLGVQNFLTLSKFLKHTKGNL